MYVHRIKKIVDRFLVLRCREIRAVFCSAVGMLFQSVLNHFRPQLLFEKKKCHSKLLIKYLIYSQFEALIALSILFLQNDDYYV